MKNAISLTATLLIFCLILVLSAISVNAAEPVRYAELPPDVFHTDPCDGGAGCPGRVFGDMPPAGHWAHDAIDWALLTQVTTGASSTAFAPGSLCTRAQIVTFLWRAKGSPEPGLTTSPFTDVAPGRYYTKAVLWALEQGITKGVSASSFAPNQVCTRAQIVTFLWRAKGSPASAAEGAFRDVRPGQYYYQAVLWAVGRGITKGVSASAFAPNAYCTRAEAVTFLWRAA